MKITQLLNKGEYSDLYLTEDGKVLKYTFLEVEADMEHGMHEYKKVKKWEVIGPPDPDRL